MLVVLLGPTGVGKTALSLALAERLGCPILNADSRQIYRHMPIGTAAPTPAERQRVHHYFVEELEPDDYFSAARYETEALKGFYEKLGKLRLVEGNQPIEDATRDILAALGV